MKIKCLPVGPLQANCYLLADAGGRAAIIDPGGDPEEIFSVIEREGELAVSTHLHTLIEGVFVDAGEAGWIAAQWRHALRDLRVTESFNARRLVKLLVSLRKTNNDALRKRVVNLDEQIQDLDQQIAQQEQELNEIIYGLYDLTDDERRMVEEG